MVSTIVVRSIVAALVGAALIVPATAQANGRHRHHHHRHHRHMHMTMGSPMMQTNTFGQFPNVVFFTQDGHTYATNIEDNFTYLVR